MTSKRPGDLAAMVPIEPFAAWLEQKYKRHIAMCGGPGGSREISPLQDFSLRIGLSGEQVDRYIRRKQAQVRWALVDRVLVAEGSTNLGELYPELYPDLGQAA